MKRTPTVEDIRDMPQLARLSLVVPIWEYQDGTAVEIVVRARTFRERRQCILASLEAGKDGKPDEDTWAIETVLAGMVEPQFTRDQISILWNANPTAIDVISEAIVRLEEIPARRLSQEIIRQTGAPEEVVAPEEN